jgi:hypothetical protein
LDGASLMMFTHQMVSTAEEEEEEVAEVDAWWRRGGRRQKGREGRMSEFSRRDIKRIQ